jgi:hypothetical protein
VTEDARVPSHRARWDERTGSLLEEWHLRATAAQFGHQTRADATRRLYLLLGVPVVALTTLVGTSVFATFNETPSQMAKFFVGALSNLAAVLAAIQTFLSYGQLTERHRTAASRYASNRRTIEVAVARRDASAVDRIRVEMDKVGAASPQIGHKVWEASLVEAEAAIEKWRREEFDRDSATEASTIMPSSSA